MIWDRYSIHQQFIYVAVLPSDELINFQVLSKFKFLGLFITKQSVILSWKYFDLAFQISMFTLFRKSQNFSQCNREACFIACFIW